MRLRSQCLFWELVGLRLPCTVVVTCLLLAVWMRSSVSITPSIFELMNTLRSAYFTRYGDVNMDVSVGAVGLFMAYFCASNYGNSPTISRSSCLDSINRESIANLKLRGTS